MTSTSPRPMACPRNDCSSPVAYSSESEMQAGAPLWQCRSQHHGPRFIGFDDYQD